MKLLIPLALYTAGAVFPALPALAQQTGTAADAMQQEMQHKLTEALNETDALRLPLNKVYLYRQAATGLAATQRVQAVTLLQRALAVLDAAEATAREQRHPDAQRISRLVVARRPVLLQLVTISPEIGLAALRPPQEADGDMEFQRLIFEQVMAKDPDVVREAALNKLAGGATPAAVAAYAVLRQRDPQAARMVATDIVAQLGQQDPAKSPQAVQAAFGLLRLVRSDGGARATQIIVNPTLMDETTAESLFAFLGNALLAAKDPEMLILPEAPKAYIAALQQYAPSEADAVAALPFAAPGATSLIFAPDTAGRESQAGGLSAEQQKQQQQLQIQGQQQMQAQVQHAAMQFVYLREKAADPAVPFDEARQAAIQAVAQVNQCLSLGRSLTPALQPEEFQDGELELYADGPLTGVLDSLTGLLADFTKAHPQPAARSEELPAFAALEQLEAPAAQAAVSLKLALQLRSASQTRDSASAAASATARPTGPAR